MTCPRCRSRRTAVFAHDYRCRDCAFVWDGCEDACHDCGRCKCLCGDD